MDVGSKVSNAKVIIRAEKLISLFEVRGRARNFYGASSRTSAYETRWTEGQSQPRTNQ